MNSDHDTPGWARADASAGDGELAPLGPSPEDIQAAEVAVADLRNLCLHAGLLLIQIAECCYTIRRAYPDQETFSRFIRERLKGVPMLTNPAAAWRPPTTGRVSGRTGGSGC